ncbi:MAG TPA: endonuclease/exonuclease/phosphatase family protein, partial [Gemmatimonadota bacterium]|nr:endonuclease/exonuclease/phosphatase family protein [Gemmatimonadota bacterium]
MYPPRIIKTSAWCAAIGALLLVAACENGGTTDPAAVDRTAMLGAAAADAGRITVMTQNLYVGAPIEAVFDPLIPFPVAAWQLWQHVKATDFEERARAIADEIERHRPHLIGLNEVTYFDVQMTQTGAKELDFLEVLLTELGNRGLTYLPVAYVQNFAASPVPLYDTPENQGVATLVDLDVILARGDVAVNPSSVVFDNYEAVVVEEAEIPGYGTVPIPIWRGWASIVATVEGLTFRFVVTHLEPGEENPDIQEEQGDELIAALAGETLPLVVVGDMNSAADRSTTATYGHMIDTGGFTDAWKTRGDGYTCCQQPDLLNVPSILDRRVDLILLRGDFGLAEPGFRGAVHAEIVGNEVADLTPSGLWPSDHAGVVATIKLPRRSRN